MPRVVGADGEEIVQVMDEIWNPIVVSEDPGKCVCNSIEEEGGRAQAKW